MLETLKKYFQVEYNLAKTAIESGAFYIKPADTVWYAIQRCLGAVQFAQMMDGSVEFQEYENLYNLYKEKLEKLLDN